MALTFANTKELKSRDVLWTDTKVFANTIVQWTLLFKSGLIATMDSARPFQFIAPTRV